MARSSVTWRWDSSAFYGLYLRLESGPFPWSRCVTPAMSWGRQDLILEKPWHPTWVYESMTLLAMLVLILLVLCCAGLWFPRSYKTFYHFPIHVILTCVIVCANTTYNHDRPPLSVVALYNNNRSNSQITQCTSFISHNARFRKGMGTFLFCMVDSGNRKLNSKNTNSW